MAIDFTGSRWDQLRQIYAAWRQGNDTPPILGFEMPRDPGRARPVAPLLGQSNCTDLSYSAQQVVDTIVYHLESKRYFGCAYPYYPMHAFGPGVLAAFCGAEIKLSSTKNVWFMAPEKNIEDIHITFDEDSKWFRRVANIYQAATERFEGNAVLGMTDLGGTMDVVATFVGSQNLLYALYDAPEEVQRLVDEAHIAWWQAYDKLNAIIAPSMPGFSDWFGVYYPAPGGYILQCDFCYMIGPKMFRQFVQGEMAKTAAKLTWPLYHWDGTGELPHYEALMEITPKIQAVQWVPGDGNPPQQEWPEVLRSLGRAGRKLLIYDGGPREIERIMHLPDVTPGQIYHSPWFVMDGQQEEYEALLRKYNVII